MHLITINNNWVADLSGVWIFAEKASHRSVWNGRSPSNDLDDLDEDSELQVSRRNFQPAKTLGLEYLVLDTASASQQNNMRRGLLHSNSTMTTFTTAPCGATGCTVHTIRGTLSTHGTCIVYDTYHKPQPSATVSTLPLHFHICSDWIVECDGVMHIELLWIPEEWRTYLISEANYNFILLQKPRLSDLGSPYVLLDVSGCFNALGPRKRDKRSWGLFPSPRAYQAATRHPLYCAPSARCDTVYSAPL